MQHQSSLIRHKMNLKSFYRRNRIFLLCIVFVVFGLFLRCLHIVEYSIQSRDSYTYMDDIAHFQKNELVTEKHHPVLSIYLMSIPSRYFGLDNTKGGVIVNMMLGVWTVFLIVKTSFNILKSVLLTSCAGILTASNSNLIYYSTQLLRETSFLFFVCAALELLTRKEPDKLLKTFMLGFYTTCAVLCRVEGVEIVIVYFLFKAVFFLFDKQKTAKKFKTLVVHCVLYLFSMVSSLFLFNFFFTDGLHLEKLKGLFAL